MVVGYIIGCNLNAELGMEGFCFMVSVAQVREIVNSSLIGHSDFLGSEISSLVKFKVPRLFSYKSRWSSSEWV